jgi:uncharacterized membrane protein YiaA
MAVHERGGRSQNGATRRAVAPQSKDLPVSHTAAKPTAVFVAASWLSLAIGLLAYGAALWNAPRMALDEKGFYLTMLLFGLFAAVSLQKTVRDRMEGLPVTGLYVGLCWGALLTCLALLGWNLWHSALPPTEQGFYAMAFVLSLFSTVAIQKNVRDAVPAQ